MAQIHTHYDNLKVARNAPPEVIRAAYKTLSQKFHPDRNHGNAEAARIMAIINASYEVFPILTNAENMIIGWRNKSKPPLKRQNQPISRSGNHDNLQLHLRLQRQALEELLRMS